MKRLIPLLLTLVFMVSACGLPGSQPEPTAVSLPTAVPTSEAAQANPTAQAQNAQAGDTRNSATDGMIQIFVPANVFRMGGLDNDAQDDEKPDRKVTLSAFWIDKVEVTNAMYNLCVQAGACETPREFKSATQERYFGNPDFNDFPVVFVNWEDAKAYCAWAGRRLPSEAEWEYAARGTDYRRFPWGDASPTNQLANYDNIFRDTQRVGSFPNGASSFGALDMAGNVWEWVADFYSPNSYTSAGDTNPMGPATAGVNGPRRVIRGGSWADNFKDLRVSNRGFALAPDLSADSRSEAYMGEAKNSIGFRCAANN